MEEQLTKKVELDTAEMDEVTHCPINKEGKPITSHLIQ